MKNEIESELEVQGLLDWSRRRSAYIFAHLYKNHKYCDWYKINKYLELFAKGSKIPLFDPLAEFDKEWAETEKGAK